MKNKREINLDDKKRYLKFCIMTRFIDHFFILIFSAFLAFAVIAIISTSYHINNLKDINIIYYILCYIFFVLVFLVFRRSFKVLFFKNMYVIDGHIFKKNVFASQMSGSSGGETIYDSKARAISEDGGTTTGWIRFPQKYFKKEDIPVKIIIFKNKAIDFYVEEYKMLKSK